MPEAEVSLRLAEYLLFLPGAGEYAEVAIDGASILAHGEVVFDIERHLAETKWRARDKSVGRNTWTCTYERDGRVMNIHSRPGVGDVVASLNGKRLIAECKKGPQPGKRGSPERPLLAAALGQALLLPVTATDIAVAAVPDTPAFRKIASDWLNRPLVIKSGIKIALVSRLGTVAGLEL